MTTYYNENDAYAQDWLENLIETGEISAGTVDRRSIKDVEAEDVMGYERVHFFAGIGGWELALRLVGWPEGREVWTGSCPCQPFSVAGKRKGESDERHLWPEFLRLISERKPSVLFGEQVASKAGREWLDRVRLDLEALGYAVGAADLSAAGVGAPHIRQRLFWVADTEHEPTRGGVANVEGQSRSGGDRSSIDSDAGRMDNAPIARRAGERIGETLGATRDEAWMQQSARSSTPCLWDEFDVVKCNNTKGPRLRRIEPGTFPLAYGLPRKLANCGPRVSKLDIASARAFKSGSLKGYGNAIVPQVAAEFIRAFLNTEREGE